MKAITPAFFYPSFAILTPHHFHNIGFRFEEATFPIRKLFIFVLLCPILARFVADTIFTICHITSCLSFSVLLFAVTLSSFYRLALRCNRPLYRLPFELESLTPFPCQVSLGTPCRHRKLYDIRDAFLHILCSLIGVPYRTLLSGKLLLQRFSSCLYTFIVCRRLRLFLLVPTVNN